MASLIRTLYGSHLKGGWNLAVDAVRGCPKLRAARTDVLKTVHKAVHADGIPFPTVMLDLLGGKVEITGDLRSVPASGPLLVIANHPDGGLFDALAFMDVLHRLRPAYKLFGNKAYLEYGFPIEARLLPVSRTDRLEDSRVVSAGLAHLREGGCVGLFPEGVAPGMNSKQGASTAYAWTPLPAGMLMHLNARGLKPVLLPVFIDLPRPNQGFLLAQRVTSLFHSQTMDPLAPLAMQGKTIRVHVRDACRLEGTALRRVADDAPVLDLPSNRAAAKAQLLAWMKTTIQKPKGPAR